MITTEAEAMKKWCPFIRFSDEGADAYSMSNQGIVLHRDVEPALLTRCIASSCMAWRWQNLSDHLNETDSKGYCGAFGPAP